MVCVTTCLERAAVQPAGGELCKYSYIHKFSLFEEFLRDTIKMQLYIRKIQTYKNITTQLDWSTLNSIILQLQTIIIISI